MQIISSQITYNLLKLVGEIVLFQNDKILID